MERRRGGAWRHGVCVCICVCQCVSVCDSGSMARVLTVNANCCHSLSGQNSRGHLEPHGTGARMASHAVTFCECHQAQGTARLGFCIHPSGQQLLRLLPAPLACSPQDCQHLPSGQEQDSGSPLNVTTGLTVASPSAPTRSPGPSLPLSALLYDQVHGCWPPVCGHF